MSGAAWSAPDLVRRHAVGTGDEPALIVGSDVVTWAGLDGRVDALAGELRSSGVPEGGVVAFTGEPTVETVVRILGRAPRRRRRRAAAGRADRGGDAPWRRTCSCPSSRSGARRAVATGGRRLDEPGVVVLTSGTTARRRASCCPVRALAASADAWLAALPPATRLAAGAGPRRTWPASASCGARSRRGVPMRIADGSDAAALAEAIAVARGEPRLARPDAARPPARRGRRRAAAGQPPRRAAGRRDRPGGARDAAPSTPAGPWSRRTA